jgi:hypothetical protein
MRKPLNANPIFSQTGGARVGWRNVTMPFAVISGDRNALRLSCFGRDYVFHKTTIERLSRYRGLFSLGLRIEHTVPVFPSFMVFWVSIAWSRKSFARLKEKLESLGYTVHE